MFKLSAAVLLVSVVYYTQCLPAVTQSKAETESSSKLQLYVNNGPQAETYHLSPIISDLVTENEKINADLNAILPYLNFLFGIGAGENEDGSDDCIDEMEIQLVKGD